MMSRVHPAAENSNSNNNNRHQIKQVVLGKGEAPVIAVKGYQDVERPTVLTVWKKSSMSFQGTDGFTVFNREGKLAFRVDNYSRKTGGLVLMDGTGRPLLTLMPHQNLMSSMMQYHQWNGFQGDDEGCRKRSPIRDVPVFSMRRKSNMLARSSNVKEEAQVFLGGFTRHSKKGPDFLIQGSFRRRCCSVMGGNGELVAEITRKKVINTTVLLSDDVFSLVVYPGFDPELVMAFIIIMDRICHKPFTPILCSS